MTNGSSTGSSQNKKVNYEALTSNKGKKELNSYWEKNRRSEKAKDNSSSTKHGVGSKKEEHRSTGFKNSQSFKTSKDVEASSAKKQSPKHKSENLLDPRIPQCPSKSGKGFVSTFVRPYSDNSDKNFSQKEGAEISENKKIDEDQPRSEKYAKALTPKLIRKTAAIEKERLQNFSKEEPVEIRTNISETLLSSQLRNGFITRPVTPDKGETYQPTPQPPPPPPQAEFNIINQKEETCMKTFANRVYPPPMLNYPPPPVTMTLNGQRPDFYIPQTLNVQYVRLSIDHREEYQFYPVNINFPFPIAQRMNPPLNFPPPLPPPIPPSAPPPLPLLFHQRILPPRPIPEVVRPLPVPTDPFGEAIAKFEENRSAGLGCILSTVQDYAKGLRSARDFHKDRMRYSVLMNCTTEAPFRLSCMITPQGEHGLHGWYQREKILLVPQDNIALSVVLTIISIESAGQVSVVEFIAAATAHKHLVKILQAFGSHFHATIRLISQRYDQFPLVDDFSELVRSNCCSALIYLQLYGTKFSDEERRKLETQNNIPKVVPDGIVLRGQRLNFTSDQLQAIRLGCSDNPSVVIHSAYGSGKTVVAAAIAAFAASYSTDSTVLLVSQTNAAVGQMAKVLGQFDFYKHLHPLRVEADSITSYTKILFSRTEETSIDLPQILQNFENWYQLSPDEIHDIRRFNLKYRRLVDFVQKHENCCPWGMWEKGDVLTNAQVQEALAFQEFVESLISESHRAMSIVLTYHRPRIICITVDKLVNELLVSEFVDTSRVHCSLRDFLQKADMIIVDEASQLPEFSLLRLLAVLPNTRFRFIGDSKQLAPHAVLPLDHPFVVAGARSTLQLFSDSAQRGLSIASELTTTFRSHPNMNKLPNKLFYNGRLKSGSSHQQRSQILDCLNFPNKKNPLAFIDVAGEHYKNKNGSLGNHQEADTCLELVKSLIRERNISSHRISVVTFYLEQREHLTTMFKYNNIPVHINTVDSIQGSEYDIVIVLTTKTRFTKYEEFFTDPRRINVAITRAKLAQFILGQKTSLLKVNVWKDLVSWFKDNQAIIRSQDLRKIFEPGRNIVDNNLNMLVSLTISD